MRKLIFDKESWPIRGSFTISRGSKTHAEVVVVEIQDGQTVGRGECVPYSRYGESVDGVVAAIEEMTDAIAHGMTRSALAERMAPGAARNALDCALWDLESRKDRAPVWALAGLPEPRPVTTAFTISLGTPEAMAEATKAAGDRPLLKVKLGGEGDVDRIAAVRAAAPKADLIADANEAWSPDLLKTFGPRMAELGVSLIEQPLPAGQDSALAHIDCPVPLCADESFHDFGSLEAIGTLYQAVNIKLDKTGGLTEAIRVLEHLRDTDMKIMVGCMVGTSLAMAPAYLLAGAADYVDLDGPLLLAQDRDPGLSFTGSTIEPSRGHLWGDGHASLQTPSPSL